ncbi:MAG: HD domain-containing protein, partial [Planctomycetota bacterium]
QPKEHHWDVLGHAFVCVEMLDALLAGSEPGGSDAKKLWATLWGDLDWWEGRRHYLSAEIVQGAPRSAIVKLCGFLHDIGKPETKSIDENGRMRFFGHSEAGAELAAAALRRLRFSAGEIDFVRKMIQAHLRPVQMAQQGPPSDRAIFRYFRATGDAGIATLVLSLADHLATVGPRRSWEGWRQHVALVDYILRKRVLEESVVSPPKLVRGTDLIDALGIEPGPVVGSLLAKIEEAQAAGDVTTRKQAIALARDELGWGED